MTWAPGPARQKRSAFRPSVYSYKEEGTQHILYRGLGDDHIHELWWEPDFWQHADLMTHETKPPYADGEASGYVIYDADLGTQHAVYEAEGGHHPTDLVGRRH
jgi:hypothetical protein